MTQPQYDNPFERAVQSAEQPQAPATPAAPATDNPFQAGVNQSTGRYESVDPMAHVAQTYAQQGPQPAPPYGHPQAYAPQQQAYAPQQQAYAPQQQAYAPQQPQPQAYAPQQPQAYAPQQPQPQAYAQAAPAALDPSELRGAPAPTVGEGRGPRLAHMYGRLVLVFPLSITRKPRNPAFITPEQRQRGDLDQEQITATFVILDDGRGGMSPVMFGGDPQAFPVQPDTESGPLPFVRKGLWVSQSRLIDQLRGFLPSGAGETPHPVCGRPVKTGPERNAPWFLATATEQDLALAGQYMQLVKNGTYPHPLA